jgi:predicted RNA binding protein YcfA (HicA-like mRNA interferase family)
MTKLVRISGKKMCKILESLGFKLMRQKGSHTFWQHSDGRTTVIPIHSGEELGRGLIRKILKDIEITLEEYDSLR